MLISDLDYVESIAKNDKIVGSKKDSLYDNRAVAEATFFAEPGNNSTVDFALVTGVVVDRGFSSSLSGSFLRIE